MAFLEDIMNYGHGIQLVGIGVLMSSIYLAGTPHFYPIWFAGIFVGVLPWGILITKEI